MELEEDHSHLLLSSSSSSSNSVSEPRTIIVRQEEDEEEVTQSSDEFGIDQELVNLAFSQFSRDSDTEADFLDRDIFNKITRDKNSADNKDNNTDKSTTTTTTPPTTVVDQLANNEGDGQQQKEGGLGPLGTGKDMSGARQKPACTSQQAQLAAAVDSTKVTSTSDTSEAVNNCGKIVGDQHQKARKVSSSTKNTNPLQAPHDPVKKKKNSVSKLIAQFESSKEEEGSASRRSVSPTTSLLTKIGVVRSARSVTPERSAFVAGPLRSLSPERPVSAAPGLTKPDRTNSNSKVEDKKVAEEVREEVSKVTETETDKGSQSVSDVEASSDRQEVEETLPLGAEALSEASGKGQEGQEDEEEGDMPKKNGAFTSYVFIGNGGPLNDETSSVVSNHSAHSSSGSNKIVVNVTDAANNGKGVILQDGRASNISIVSTESSELGSPNSPVDGIVDAVFEPPPDLPAKIRTRNGAVVDQAGPDMEYFVAREPFRDYGQRSRGGEPDEFVQDQQDTREDDSPPSDLIHPGQPGLDHYYTSALESSTPSRRGRPPVIRAAERLRRQHGPDHYDEGEGEVMIEYDQYQDPEYDREDFRITEMAPDGTPYDDMYTDEMMDNEGGGGGQYAHYDVRYESEEHSGDEEYVDNQDYPMCQPVAYDSEEYVSEGDEYFDREEELRGYNRQIDFTLHTILEESCEDSEPDLRHSLTHTGRKRMSDPSEMEKYFLYGVGGRTGEEPLSDEVYSDSPTTSPEADYEAEENMDGENRAFFSGQLTEADMEPQSMDAAIISDNRNTDDSGSVGSESDGQRSPDPKNKKKVVRSKGSRHSDRGESDNNTNSSTVEEDSHRDMERSYSSGSSDGGSATGSMKRNKNKKRRGSASDVELRKQLAAEQHEKNLKNDHPPPHGKESPSSSLSPKVSPPITPLPTQIIEVQPASAGEIKSNNRNISPSSSTSDRPGSRSPKDKLSQLFQSPSASPPVNGPVRKHKSRDSGFVGSMDDLLRNESNGQGVHTSSDSTPSLSDGENSKPAGGGHRLEKVSEVSGENTEDDNHTETKPVVQQPDQNAVMAKVQLKKTSSSNSCGVSQMDPAKLVRKDSFNNWSSDEDTNIMMNRMRSFFRSLLLNNSSAAEQQANRGKPQQLVAFEAELTRLMRTVPGINEEQVKEIVEYLSSEDTWSDSYDSSDYTSSDIDLEGYGIALDVDEDPAIPELDTSAGLQSHKVLDQKSQGESDDFQKETALMYQKLMAKMQQNQAEKEERAKHLTASVSRSPPIAAKVMHHISTRLVALMHEVSSGQSSNEDQQPSSLSDKGHMAPPTRRYKSNKPVNRLPGGDEEEHKPVTDEEEEERLLKYSKATSRSVEVLDTAGRRRKSLDDKSISRNLATARSEYDVWQGVQRNEIAAAANAIHGAHVTSVVGGHAVNSQRRGSLGHGGPLVHSGSSSGVSDLLNDDERWSWKGSFESALAVGSIDPRNGSKRKSLGSTDTNSELCGSVEQIPKGESRSPGSKKKARSGGSSQRTSLSSKGPTSNRLQEESDSAGELDALTVPPPPPAPVLQPSKVVSARFRKTSDTKHPSPSQLENSQQQAAPPSTISLPRLGTSSIQAPMKKLSHPPPPPVLETSEATLQLQMPKRQHPPSSAGGQQAPRSARYRPHGYRPPPAKKASPTSRKSSVDSVSRFTDDVSELSSKSGTPSPILGGPRLPHGVVASRDLVRDFRESSVHSRTSSHGEGSASYGEEQQREESVPRDDQQRHPSPFNRVHNTSTTSLVSRSESMASVYSADGGRYGTVNVKGEVEFGMIYSLHAGSLELAVKQCKELAAVDTKRNRSDPYVKVYLLPDKSKSGKRKTKVKKHTLNPVFDEILKFHMPLEEVERRTLWLTVWHSDMFGRNDFLGEVMLAMNQVPLDDPQSRWYDLRDRSEPLSDELACSPVSYRGEIIVALKFIPPNANCGGSPSKKLGRRNSNSKGTLVILVKEAKNLVAPKGSNSPDPFCKCYLLPEKGKGVKQKTGVCRKTVCPKWEQTLAWDDISLDALADRSLELTIWDHDRLGHNEILGGVRFNLGTGKHQGRATAWMDSSGGEVTLWQQMLDRPNFWVEGSVPLRPAEKMSIN